MWPLTALRCVPGSDKPSFTASHDHVRPEMDPTMRPQLFIPVWTCLPFALALLFIGWSLWLIVAVHHQRGELATHLGLTGKLLRLEAATRDLDLAVAPATGHDWGTLHGAFHRELLAVRTHGGLGDIEPILARIENEVDRLQALQAPSHTAGFRGRLLDILRQLGAAVRSARGRSSGISVDLAVKWQELNALAVIAGLLALGLALAVRLYRQQILERQRAEVILLDLKGELADRVCELEKALAEVTQLRGLIPICSYCKSIRDDKNFWQRVEDYLMARSDVRFTHGICPTCLERVTAELKQ